MSLKRKLIESKNTADVVNDTIKALNIKNGDRSKKLLEEIGFTGTINDFIRTIILEFIRQSAKRLLQGYKVSIINFITVFPDIIHHSEDVYDSSITLKCKVCSGLLTEASKMSINQIKFREANLEYVSKV